MFNVGGRQATSADIRVKDTVTMELKLEKKQTLCKKDNEEV